MGSRRKSREFALQMLYQAEASGTPMAEVAVSAAPTNSMLRR